MRGPDGAVYPNRGVFEEIDRPRLLVFRIGALDPDGNMIIEAVNNVTFTEQGGKTTVTVRVRIVNATPGAAFYINAMDQGWRQTLERLAEQMETESKERLS
jgi:uncharacterized protein YndB with AHSA1/START domain